MALSVQEHYGSSYIVEKILVAVPWSKQDGRKLHAEALYPFDQFHGRELLATQEHARRLEPGAGEHILDVGSGIGGPARYMANTYGCRVSGIDITERFVAAANELTALCGMEGQASFARADAAALPFDDDVFEHGYCFYVGMNLPDRAKVLRECARVVRPGGRFVWSEAVLNEGNPIYPLPWSLTAEGSHLVGKEALVALIEKAGFEILTVADESAEQLQLAAKMKAAGKSLSSGQHQANEVVLGPDFAERRANYIQSLGRNCLAALVIVARVAK
ncbi:methyltransferase domain-containing protein [Devosia rhodophyticola]|uniref:Methyltransferase domain-containing protein n=1 Tax=Devosia rhodophyticola TaxID=3026423 RepID=A0ABY7YVD6_9HYPH|nr:methyltransferase domain-containing protein [Devosia rhodophyticola]WDR05152.1 methyltransferase domain-containing protein [Devosia rhodophyticola]